MLISIILPIYNMEKYLDRCMESIFMQTYRNLQIIMVDDGSVDSSPAMCDAYAQKDSRIVVIHKENGGLSSARNAGMERAKGEYIFFFDPDDTIPQDAIEKLVKVAKKHPYDIIKALHYVNKNGERRLTHYTWDEGCVNRNGTPQEKERWRQLKTAWSFGCAWAGIYRRDFLQEKGIIFDDNKKIFLEDVLFNSKLFALDPEYYMLCEPVYEYFYVEGSLLNRYTPNMSQKLRSLLAEYSCFLKERDLFEENMDLLVTLTARYFCWTASETAKEKKWKFSEIFQEIKEFGTDETIAQIIDFPDSMKQLNNLARRMDSIFYTICVGMLKRHWYKALTIIFMMLSSAMEIYAGRRTRV